MKKIQYNTQLAIRLWHAREARGISSEEVKDAIGLEVHDLTMYEQGRRFIPAFLLLQLAELYDMPVVRFFEAITDQELVENVELRFAEEKNMDRDLKKTR